MVLVRHGASRSSEVGVVGGHEGCRGLSAEGVFQSERLGRRWLREPPFNDEFPLGGLYSSLMRRSGETAAIALSSFSVPRVRALCSVCEIHPGLADGLSWQEVSERFGDIDIVSNPSVPIAPGGESWREMKARAAGALLRIARQHLCETVIVFTHRGVIEATLECWAGAGAAGRCAGVENVSVTTWRFKQNEHGALDPMLISYNDTAHLLAV